VCGELVVEQCKTVEVHLCECRRCVVLVETYRHTIRFGKCVPRCDRLPAEVEARLRKAIEPYLTDAAGEPAGA
jgi:anti-sigma factor RsiW